MSKPILVAHLLDQTLDLINSNKQPQGLSTGFHDLDIMMNGLQESTLTVLAGRPQMGKTALARNISEHVALIHNKPVIYFSMTMASHYLMMQSIASIGSVNISRIRGCSIEKKQDSDNIITASNTLKNNCTYFIDDSPNVSHSEISSRSRKIAKEYGNIGLIVIDNLQLMRFCGNSENKKHEISKTIQSLKVLARVLNTHVLVLSQLSRSLEERENKHPVMVDISELQSIEHYVDQFAFIYQDEIYNRQSEHKGLAEITIGSRRFGSISTAWLNFERKHCRFTNYKE